MEPLHGALLVLCSFLAPTSCCLAEQCPSLCTVLCFLCMGCPGAVCHQPPHSSKHYQVLQKGFPSSHPCEVFLHAHMWFLCLVQGLHSPPVSGKCVTVSGLASAPGTKPGESRDERMLSSSEFASLFPVALVSMATVTHSFSAVAQTQHWPGCHWCS